VKISKKIKNSLVYYFVLCIVGFFNAVPRSTALFFGSVFGYAAYLLVKKDRLKAERHLKLIYGTSIKLSERRLIVRRLFINFGKNIAEAVRFKKYYFSQIQPLIDVEGIEYFDEVYKRGKGVIAVTGHIGNFELLAAYFANAGYNAAVIGREMYDKRLDRLLVGNRAALNVVNIDTNDSPRRVLKVLKEGFALGVLIDTDSMRVRSEFIPAFGRLSYTPVGQTILGLKTGAGFIPMACVRDGKRYKIIIRPEIKIESTGDFDRDVYNITKRCTAALEEIIDNYKDQWIWIHNRWLTKPE
jgi:Kdo2-lipid IVA lauroyltransferase/acyltransferase